MYGSGVNLQVKAVQGDGSCVFCNIEVDDHCIELEGEVQQKDCTGSRLTCTPEGELLEVRFQSQVIMPRHHVCW